MRELALFAGAGGGILGGHLLGWRTVCAVEYDPYAIAVLCARQNDGVLPPFPIWDDIRTFDGTPWRGGVDVVSGGFPCTDISSAGKGAGIDGEASGLWSEMARVIGEVRPEYVFVENSPLLVSRGLARVLGDLAKMGYDARWGVLGADDAGAPHRRKRIWIVAHAQGIGHGQGREPGDVREEERGQDGSLHGVACGAGDVAHPQSHRGQVAERCEPGQSGAVVGGAASATVSDAESISRWPGLRQDDTQRDVAVVADGGADVPGARLPRLEGHAGDGDGGREPRWLDAQQDGPVGTEDLRPGPDAAGWWQLEPAMDRMVDGISSRLHGTGPNFTEGVGRVATGVPARVQRLKCIGNGQVPAVAALAWRLLTTVEVKP